MNAPFEQFQLENFETVMGAIRVLHVQQEGGRATGDLMVIDGQQFEIDDFSGTNRYKTTCTNSWHLRNGVGAPVVRVGDQIALVEIKESDLN